MQVDAAGAPCPDPSTPECRARGGAPGDYDTETYEIVLALLRGLRAGLARANDGRPCAVNAAGALHYGFLDRLRADGRDWSVTACHWCGSARISTPARFCRKLNVASAQSSRRAPRKRLWTVMISKQVLVDGRH